MCKKKDKVKKVIVFLLVGFAVMLVGLFIFIQCTQVSTGGLPALKNGDLVFQTIKAPQSIAIIAATRSAYTHVGMIKMVDGQPIVVEAVGPVREIALSEWVLQGVAGRIAIKRFKNLSDSDADKILSRAKFYYGRPYDFYFLFDKEAIYCSELVYYAFEEGAQISLGNIERVGDLRTQSTAVKNLIKERWKSYPICLDQGVDSYEGCYDIVMNQNLITPSSVAEDSRLEIIYSNYY